MLRGKLGLVRLGCSTLLALLLPLAGCGGRAAKYEFSITVAGASAGGSPSLDSGAGTSSASGATSGGASVAGDGGHSSSGSGGTGADAGGDAGSPVDGGAAGTSQAAGSSGDAGFGGVAGPKACSSATECPRPANACLAVRCTAGSCVTDNVPAGALFVLDAPADCHATTACDGLGHATLVVAEENAPTPVNQCLVGNCNASGAIGSEPLPSGARCNADSGAGKCDGKGNCVACLVTADCPLGQACTAYHACVGQPCTDSHCGGACPACKPCLVDRDCASNACDSVTLRCLADQQCADQRQDGNETDTDCGGGLCSLCAPGKACLANTDCASFACDAVSLRCVASTCLDHRMDSDESDVDCGGTNQCNLCGVGKKCNSNFDCVPGHVCNASHVCQ